MTEAQAEAVVRLQLGQLAALERDEILKEYTGLREQIRGYERLLSDEANIQAVIREDLEELRDKYGDDRKTEITDDGGDVDMEDLIAEEDVVVTLSHEGLHQADAAGHVPRRRAAAARACRAGLREDDFIEHFFVASHEGLPALLHQPRAVSLAEGVRHPAGDAGPAAGRSIANVLSLEAGREDRGRHPGPRVRGGRVPAHGDPERAGEEDGADGVQPAAAGRHHRHQARRGRRADRRGPGPSRATRSC